MFNGFGQNLEKIGKKDMVTVHGGLNFNTISYFTDRDFSSRDPFQWYASGNLTVNIADVSLPFTYSYSNRRGTFTQPFNQTAVHPKYKWVQAHAGVTNMSFSNYTLAGHIFAGGGLELTPKKWKISLMGGRLNKPIEYDAVADNLNQIAYRRFGYGMKVGYEDKGYGISAILFKARDVKNSLNFIPLNTEIKPQDNLVMSLEAKAKIGKKLNWSGEYALSGLTNNLNSEDSASTNTSFLTNNFLFINNGTTDVYSAYKTAISYTLKNASIAFNFEHVDPGYRTLGGYYFNNDLENYTLAPSVSLLKKKMTVAANFGFQRNNLGQDSGPTTKRWIGSVNVNYVPVATLAFTGSYSNFSSYTRNRPTTDPFYFNAADTLNFYQISQNASAGVNWSFGKSKNKSAMQLMYNYQESVSLTGSIFDAGAFGINVTETGIPAKVHMANLGYSKQLVSIGTSLSIAGNVNQTILPTTTTLFFGPSLNLSKQLFKKKGSLSLGSTYNQQLVDDVLTSNVFSHRLSFGYSPKFKNTKAGKIRFSLSGNWLQKLPTVNSVTSINEVTVFANIGYTI